MLTLFCTDIYSASWGPDDDGRTVDGPGPLTRRALGQHAVISNKNLLLPAGQKFCKIIQNQERPKNYLFIMIF
jgi:hypothetical protein